MRKKLYIVLLSIFTILAMVACNSSENTSDSNETSKETKSIDDIKAGEVPTIYLAYNPISGHIFHAIAEDQGFYEDEGIKVETSEVISTADAFQALNANKLQIASTYGTNAPLQRIAEGQDVDIIGGYMLEGDVQIFAKTGTEWNGLEDLIGKKVAGNMSSYPITGPLLDKGYDPIEDITWVDIGGFVDRLQSVKSGEVDYTTGTTGITPVAEEMGLEAIAYFDDAMPEYSCCRIAVNRTWAKDNPDQVQSLLRSWIRAQQYYEDNKEYTVDLMLEQIDSTREQVESYIFNEEHFDLNIDPSKKQVVRAWDYIDRLGLMPENISLQMVDDSVKTSEYKEALDYCKQNYGEEDPEFYERQTAYFEENSSKSADEYLKELQSNSQNN